MTTHLTAKSTLARSALGALGGLVLALPTWAQSAPQSASQNAPIPASVRYPITPAQRGTANTVAQAGVPLSALAPTAPDRYTVKSGDTLWAISSMYLLSPWRWPELWGMNLADIRNPHLIYPGQVLLLIKRDGMATLRVEGAEGSGADNSEPPVVRVVPQTRYEATLSGPLPALRPKDVEPFLAEPRILDEEEYASAPYVVATQEGRVLLTRGDRAYVRGPNNVPLLDDTVKEKKFRVYQAATPLIDPDNGKVLGLQAVFAGTARLVAGETSAPVPEDGDSNGNALVPATIEIITALQEIKVGDRILPELPRTLQAYAPHAPQGPFAGRIVSVYGSAVENVAQNQIVVIDHGADEGMDVGTVLAIHGHGARIADEVADRPGVLLKLPDERKGLLMVFKTFSHLSYALVLEITDSVRTGDRLKNPN